MTSASRSSFDLGSRSGHIRRHPAAEEERVQPARRFSDGSVDPRRSRRSMSYRSQQLRRVRVPGLRNVAQTARTCIAAVSRAHQVVGLAQSEPRPAARRRRTIFNPQAHGQITDLVAFLESLTEQKAPYSNSVRGSCSVHKYRSRIDHMQLAMPPGREDATREFMLEAAQIPEVRSRRSCEAHGVAVRRRPHSPQRGSRFSSCAERTGFRVRDLQPLSALRDAGAVCGVDSLGGAARGNRRIRLRNRLGLIESGEFSGVLPAGVKPPIRHSMLWQTLGDMPTAEGSSSPFSCNQRSSRRYRRRRTVHIRTSHAGSSKSASGITGCSANDVLTRCARVGGQRKVQAKIGHPSQNQKNLITIAAGRGRSRATALFALPTWWARRQGDSSSRRRRDEDPDEQERRGVAVDRVLQGRLRVGRRTRYAGSL